MACFVLSLAGSSVGVPGSNGDDHFEADFVEVAADLVGVHRGAVAWGDYDDDGDLDILLTGDTVAGPISRVYRNDAGIFADVSAGLPGVTYSSAAWGDCDNDGDLDLLLTGWSGASALSRVYRNDDGVFTVLSQLPGVMLGSGAWADYDGDGDLDLLLTGWSSARITRLYRNDTTGFTDVATTLPAVFYSTVAWGDCDNDGDVDLLLAGDAISGRMSRVYRNDEGTLTDTATSFPGVSQGSADWGDYDADGDLDLVLMGSTGAEGLARVYRNAGGNLSDIMVTLPEVSAGAAAWGDYDNDGDLDLLLTGDAGPEHISQVRRNDGAVFSDIGAALPGVSDGAAAWGDYDGDGDLDLLLTGDSGSGYISRIYRSDGVAPGGPPSAPDDLAMSVTGNRATLSWTAATDDHTPSAALSYNVRVGTTPGGEEICSGMADVVTGYRRVPRLGNAQQRTSYSVVVPPGPCYWTVQAIDGSYLGSPFAPERHMQVVAFVDVDAGLPGSGYAGLIWGDYDRDSDLDICLASMYGRLLRNDADTFTIAATLVPNLYGGDADWGDYDNDGDVDLVLTGDTSGAGDTISRVYRNDAGAWHDINAGLPGLFVNTAAWGDYDRDGDLDLLLSGWGSSAGSITRLYRNDAGSFVDVNAGLPGATAFNGTAWGDYDADGDLDIVLTGSGDHGDLARVYRNDAGTFVDIVAGLPGLYEGVAAWSDIEPDGDLDLLMAGKLESNALIARIYRNDSGVFVDGEAGLPGFYQGDGAWGDYDNDGDVDLVLSGNTDPLGGVNAMSRIYQNSGGVFSDIGAGLPGVGRVGVVAWGDGDGDGDLDLLLGGRVPLGSFVTYLYRNDGSSANAAPNAPSGLSAETSPGKVILSWEASTDDHTPVAGLSYNVRVGTTSGGEEVSSSMADASTGHRYVIRTGNAQQRTSYSLVVPAGLYYWSVQAIDGAFVGSPFADEQLLDTVTGTAHSRDAAPRVSGLYRGVPNPFSGAVTFQFDLATGGRTRLEIFDVMGRRVRVLMNGDAATGRSTAVWDGCNGLGGLVPPGVYFVRLESGDFSATTRVVHNR